MGIHNCLNGVCNDFAAWQAIEHPIVSHCNTIIYADCIKLKWHATVFSDLILDNGCIFVEEKVPWNYLNKAVCNTNKWFVKIFIFKPRGS